MKVSNSYLNGMIADHVRRSSSALTSSEKAGDLEIVFDFK